MAISCRRREIHGWPMNSLMEFEMALFGCRRPANARCIVVWTRLLEKNWPRLWRKQWLNMPTNTTSQRSSNSQWSILQWDLRRIRHRRISNWFYSSIWSLLTNSFRRIMSNQRSSNNIKLQNVLLTIRTASSTIYQNANQRRKWLLWAWRKNCENNWRKKQWKEHISISEIAWRDWHKECKTPKPLFRIKKTLLLTFKWLVKKLTEKMQIFMRIQFWRQMRTKRCNLVNKNKLNNCKEKIKCLWKLKLK